MKRCLLGGLLLFVAACTSSPEQKEKIPAPEVATAVGQTSSGPLARSEVGLVNVTAKVVAVDTKTRMITFEGPGGEQVEVVAGPEVKRFDEIKPGSLVNLKYYTSMEYEVRTPTAEEIKSPAAAVVVGRNTADLPPGAQAAKVFHAVVTIKELNRKEETVTVQWPSGRTSVFKAKDPSNLERVKVGDTVTITYTEAIAVQVETERK